jgi:N,N'-diacetyllegionaminate synthase
VFQHPESSHPLPPAALRPDGAVTIVAEAAQGYEGDLALARLLVRAAAAAGADVVKLQLVYADELTLPAHRHHRLFRDLEMPDTAWHEVAAEARRCGIGLAFDVFGPRSLDLAMACGAHAVKIHASDVFNHPLVAGALRRAPHVYLSAGGISADEVDALLRRHAPDWSRLTLLSGFQAEPTATGDNHLARLGALRQRFPSLGLGFMDHADGAGDEATWLAVLALPFGVSVIEKHVTLDRALALEDYVSAVAPDRFAAFVARVRAAEAALGRDDLALTQGERAYRRKALKITVAVGPLPVGHRVEAGDVRLVRTAIDDRSEPIYQLESAIGRTLRCAVEADRPVYEDDLA